MIIIFRYMFYSGMTIWPFILLKEEKLKHDVYIMNHEKIHLRQEAELLVIPFYIIYLFNYLFNLIKYRKHFKAYKRIIFEREAYNNHHNLDYLRTRKPFSWLKYI